MDLHCFPFLPLRKDAKKKNFWLNFFGRVFLLVPFVFHALGESKKTEPKHSALFYSKGIMNKKKVFFTQGFSKYIFVFFFAVKWKKVFSFFFSANEYFFFSLKRKTIMIGCYNFFFFKVSFFFASNFFSKK